MIELKKGQPVFWTTNDNEVGEVESEGWILEEVQQDMFKVLLRDPEKLYKSVTVIPKYRICAIDPDYWEPFPRTL